MHRRRTWTALFALVTFVTGGTIMPVLHGIDHTAEWYEEQAAAHTHDQPPSEALDEACTDVATDLQHCYLCKRHFFSDLLPGVLPAFGLPSLVHDAVEPFGASLSSDGLTPIRAPPLIS